jgi:signal transduction histidine kinase
MSLMSRSLADIGAVFFIALALASVREYRRGRGRATAWGAVAFGSLGFVAALGLLPQPHGTHLYHQLWWQIAVRVLIGLIIAVPYFLYRLAATFHRPSAPLHRALTVMTLAVIAVGFVLPRLPGPGEKRPTWLIAYALAIVVQWTAASVVAAVWLWQSAAGRPTAPRKRTRMLAIGCAAFNLSILVSASRPQTTAEPNHVVQALGLVVAAIFFVALAPPAFLIDRWRRPEQAAVRAAFSDMMSAMTASEIGECLLPHIVSYVGAEGAALFDANGSVFASYGTVEPTPSGDVEEGVLRFPLRSGGDLVVRSSTFSLMFGSDKIPVLQTFADWADLALGRAAGIVRERAFISNAAHELRTPLTTLTGFADLLDRERHSMTEDQIESCLEAMTRQGRRAKDLVNNLLDMAQIERGTARFASETVKLATVVDESLEAVPPPPDRRVEVHIPPNLQVRSDPARLQQVIVNLVTNAYRYGGRSITVNATTRPDGAVTLSIIDDGEGVPVQLVPNLFNPFSRDVAAHGSGSGLGLAICRQITNALGGTITYDQSGPGACFVVTLPEAA